MTRRTHLWGMILGEFLGFAAGAAVAFWIQRRNGGWSLPQGSLWMGAAVVLGVMVPRLVFRHLISVPCDQERCRGRAYAQGSNPITYRCRQCGHQEETGVFENTRPGTLDEPDED